MWLSILTESNKLLNEKTMSVRTKIFELKLITEYCNIMQVISGNFLILLLCALHY